MIPILELVIAFLLFLSFYKPPTSDISYKTSTFPSSLMAFKKSVVVSFFSPVINSNVSFIAMFPEWVKGAYYSGQPVYLKKYYPYVIATGDLITASTTIEINLTNYSISCTSVLLLTPDFSPVISYYDSLNNTLNFTAQPDSTYYLYCFDFDYPYYQSSVPLLASTEISPPIKKANEFPIFYVCFQPKSYKGLLYLVDSKLNAEQPLNCQFYNNFYVTNYVQVPLGTEIGSGETVSYGNVTLILQ